MKMICIGNSIVNGFPHRRSESFPGVLEASTGWEVVNMGINGQSTDDVRSRFKKDAVDQKPDKILILTGANDFIFQINTPEEAMANIEAMVEESEDAGIQTIVLTPLLTDADKASKMWMPEVDIDYEQVNRELQELAQLIKAQYKAENTKVIDMQLQYKSLPEYYDGIHPTIKGQKFIAEVIKDEFPKGA